MQSTMPKVGGGYCMQRKGCHKKWFARVIFWGGRHDGCMLVFFPVWDVGWLKGAENDTFKRDCGCLVL